MFAALPVLSAESVTQTYQGVSITVESFERSEVYRPGDGAFALIAGITLGNPAQGKKGHEYAVVRLRFMVHEKGDKEVVFPKVQLVDQSGARYDCLFGDVHVSDRSDNTTDEFPFDIPKSAPSMEKLIFGEVTFDLKGVGPSSQGAQQKK